MYQLGATQQKILLLLGTAAALTFCPMNSRQIYRLLRATGKDWRKIERKNITRTMQALHERKLVAFKKNGKYFNPVLTPAGRKQADIYRMNQLRIPRPKIWDGKWRIVMFDIIEDDRSLRDFFRRQLKRLNFHELQKSVFVYPYPCRKQMERLSETYRGGASIRFIEATYIDNQKALRKHFNI